MSKRTILILSLILVLFCCCVSLIVVFITVILPKLNPEVKPTGTITPSMSMTSPTSKPTITVKISPTSIPASCDPMISGNDLIYPSQVPASTPINVTSLLDRFNSNTNLWPLGFIEGDYSLTKNYIQKGKLCVDITAKKAVYYRNFLNTLPIANLDISVEGLISSSTNGGDYGLIFRQQNANNYYVFNIDPIWGEYYFGATKDGKWITLADHIESENINSNSPNTLRVTANNNKFDLFINNHKVNSFTDDTITEGGKVGTVVGLDEVGDQAIFEFDNFSIKPISSK